MTQDLLRYPVCFYCYGRGCIDIGEIGPNDPPGTFCNCHYVPCPRCEGKSLPRSYYETFEDYSLARAQCMEEESA